MCASVCMCVRECMCMCVCVSDQASGRVLATPRTTSRVRCIAIMEVI